MQQLKRTSEKEIDQWHKIFVCGVENSGKTTLIKNTAGIDTDEEPSSVDLERYMINSRFYDFGIDAWVAPGDITLRDDWIEWINDSKLIVYVIDVSDDERLEDSKLTFEGIRKYPNVHMVPILVLFHKIDLIPIDVEKIRLIKYFNIEERWDRDILIFNSTIAKDKDGNRRYVTYFSDRIFELVDSYL